MAVALTHGTTITFSSSFFAAIILDVDWSGISRELFDITNTETSSARDRMVHEIYDAGELTVEMQFDPTVIAPITGAFETVTINWGGLGTGNKWAAEGAMSGFSITASLDAVITASGTIGFKGAITVS